MIVIDYDVSLELFNCIILSALCYIFSVALAKNLFPNTTDLYFAADALFGIFYYPVLVILAFDAVYKLHGDLESRWFGLTTSSRLLALAISSRMFVHFFYVSLKKLTKTEKRMMKLHHVICIMVYVAGLFNKRCHFWGSLGAMCEVTNIFMNNLELAISTTNAKKDEVMKGQRFGESLMYCMNSVLLMISFAIFRLCLFPMLFSLWIKDVYLSPESTWNHPNTGFMERFMYPLTTLLMFGLSLKWYGSIVEMTKQTISKRKRFLMKNVQSAVERIEQKVM